MRVLLIYPSVGYYSRGISTPLGLLSIGTYLEQFGHVVKIYDRCLDRINLKKVLNDFSPEIVGVSVMSSRALKDALYVSELVQKRGVTVVWGGQLPSLQTELVLQSPYVDMVSFGEGEETWAELLECFEKRSFDQIKGLAFKKDGKIILNPCRPFMDLAKMLPTDWSLVDDASKYMQPYLGNRRMMFICSSKGCPGRCAFCVNVNYHKRTHRKRPNDIVLQEVKELIDNYGLDSVYFSDEVWCIKRSDIIDFCQRVREEGIKFHWGVDFRTDMFKEEDFRLMYESGCRWIYYGIETGSEEMCRRIHKGIGFEKLKEQIDLLNEIGFTTLTSFIVGFPDETEEQLKETVKLIKEIHSGLTPVYHFTPIPGTEFYDYLVKEGKLQVPEKLEDLFDNVATESLGTNYSNVPDRDLKVVKNWFVWKSFTRKNAINNGKSFEFAKDTILDGLRTISAKGIVSFFVNGFLALNEFLYVFYYSHMFPTIQKKYDLK